LEDVADQRVRRGRQVGARDGHGDGQVSAGEVARATLVFRERGPELKAVGEDHGGVAAGGLVWPRPERGPDDQVVLLFQQVERGSVVGGGPAPAGPSGAAGRPTSPAPA